ncbi:MAG: RES family NAD+ phosphorylase [Boseongicola sp. SB0677_bin_26]|nr:RES family NAD+ phosphorylase [Boseongicola sp. SB0665_bin_10]MYG27938.1 RES family NAD+ phosphorylase [Boseongicola sp. SB0677_bin_26]
MAEILREVIQNNYHHSGFDHNGEPPGGDLESVLYDLTEADNHDVIEALQFALIEGDRWWPGDGDDPFFSEEARYTTITKYLDDGRSMKWDDFRQEIVGRRRFFSDRAKVILSELFDGLHLMRDNRNEPAIRTLEPGSLTLYRGRKANSPTDRRKIKEAPAKELGPPPEKLRGAGRMNPSGIPVFYGAFDVATSLAELRPFVGETVVVAEFDVLNPIVVLDTTKFESPPKSLNLFAKSYNERLSLWGFMAEFMTEISLPCLPNDEHLDYIPTQVVAEYLVHEHLVKVACEERHIEGLIFRSAQYPKGKNIVLFGSAGLVVQDTVKEDRFSWKREEGTPSLSLKPNSLTQHWVRGVTIDSNDPATLYDGYD